jgi:hypothetical protein
MNQDRLPDELLKHVKIARQCPVEWDELSGDQKTRYCGRCQLHVLNLETANQEDLVNAVLRAAAGERVCVGVSARRDHGNATPLLSFPRASSQVAQAALRSLSTKSRHAAAWIAGATTFLLSLPVCAQSSETAATVENPDPKPHLHSTISETAATSAAAKTTKQLNATAKAAKEPQYHRPELMGDADWQRYAQHPLLKPEVDKLQKLSSTKSATSTEVAVQLVVVMQLFDKLQEDTGCYYDQTGQLAESAVDMYESAGDYAAALKVCEERVEFEKKLISPEAGVRYWLWRADRCKQKLGSSSKPANER